MAKLSNNSKRYRFTVPEQDSSVQEWLDAQLNISSSLRALIRDDIIKNGCSDVTCRVVEQGPKRGRPTNLELERRSQNENKVNVKLSEEKVVAPVQVTPVVETQQHVEPKQESSPIPQVQPVYQQPVTMNALTADETLQSLLG